MKPDKEKTINDFGEQWINFPKNEGEYASIDTLKDICGPLLDTSEFEGKEIADIGSGSGRIVNMLLDAGAKHVTAVEPSSGFEILKKNTNARSQNITYLNIKGEQLDLISSFDYVVSIGVIQFIRNPDATMNAIYNSLRKYGKAIIWVYAKEGNQLYLTFIKPIRYVTSKLPHNSLYSFCKILLIFLNFYINIDRILSRFVKMPMHNYIVNVISKWNQQERLLTIYDQLNPTYAKYYTRDEAIRLMSHAGFINIHIYHRHNYSWTVCGEKN